MRYQTGGYFLDHTSGKERETQQKIRKWGGSGFEIPDWGSGFEIPDWGLERYRAMGG